MKKKFIVAASGLYDTEAEALEGASKSADNYRKDYVVFEATKLVKFPVPKFDIVDLKAA